MPTGTARPRNAWRSCARRPAAARTTASSQTSSASSPPRVTSSAGSGAAHNVRLHTKGVKQFNHPIVGELELSFNRLEVMADPGLMIVAYTAEPGSRSAEALNLLASWAATEPAGRPAPNDPEAHQVGREGR